MHQAVEEYINLFARDVRNNPSAYKESVRANPERAAKRVIDGLTYAEVRRLTRELRAEIKMLKKNPKKKSVAYKIGKTRSGKQTRTYPAGKAPRDVKRFMKAANILKRPRKNPVRKAPAYMIVGQTESGKEYYFNGPGFGSDNDVVLTFRTEDEARRKANWLKGRLPEKIRYLYVQPA